MILCVRFDNRNLSSAFLYPIINSISAGHHHREGLQVTRHQRQRNDYHRRSTRYYYRSTDKESFNSSDVTETVLANDSDEEEEQEDQKLQQSSSSSYQGTLGDIMSPTTGNDQVLFQDGLVTSEELSISKIYGITNPLDRMAITANGNLQRLFSSYYDAPVSVVVDYCHKREQQQEKQDTERGNNGYYWDRCVHLKIFDQIFCTATSKVFVHDYECQRLVDSGKVGIGQLFRYLNVLPEFELQSAGPNTNGNGDDGGFWRQYTLTSSMVTCEIHESFCPNAWNLQEQPKLSSSTSSKEQ